MVYFPGVKNNNINKASSVSFRQKANSEPEKINEKSKETEQEEQNDIVLVNKKVYDPVKTGVKIQANRLKHAFTDYPLKGLKGSKNSNFYEFLTMGTVPYIVGSGMLMAVFTAASKFFDTPSSINSLKVNKKVALGVLAYGVMKNVSKKFIQTPVKMIRGIDENLAYRKKVYELPEKGNEDDLISYEYHKVFESVDFPRWDLLYNNKDFGEDRNAFYKQTAKKYGYEDDVVSVDQKIKPRIKETLVKTKLFTTLSSYFWAATGVGVAMQKPWENIVFNPATRINNLKNYMKASKEAANAGKEIAKYRPFIKEFGETFVKSCKEFIKNPSKSTTYAGRALFGTALGMTLIGNFLALKDFNKDKGSKTQAAVSLIDENKEKVVC